MDISRRAIIDQTTTFVLLTLYMNIYSPFSQKHSHLVEADRVAPALRLRQMTLQKNPRQLDAWLDTIIGSFWLKGATTLPEASLTNAPRYDAARGVLWLLLLFYSELILRRILSLGRGKFVFLKRLGISILLLKGAELRRRLSAPVRIAEELGWTGDAIEAQAFGYLAVRSILKLPLSWPSATGVSEPVSGGVLWNPTPGSTPGTSSI